jgi:hypothetical protein
MLYEDTLATIDLSGGQNLPACVWVDTQEMSYLVRSAERRSGTDNERPEPKWEKEKNGNRLGTNSAPK